MEEQFIEYDVNNYTTMSMYEFLETSLMEEYKYRLVGFITPRQRVFNVVRKELSDDAMMLQNMGTELYGFAYPEPTVESECIRLFSAGKNLNVEFPHEITMEQYECLQDVLNQVRSFEYDYDKKVYMPQDSKTLLELADSITAPEPIQFDEEKIIGAPLEKSRRLERKREEQ